MCLEQDVELDRIGPWSFAFYLFLFLDIISLAYAFNAHI